MEVVHNLQYPYIFNTKNIFQFPYFCGRYTAALQTRFCDTVANQAQPGREETGEETLLPGTSAESKDRGG